MTEKPSDLTLRDLVEEKKPRRGLRVLIVTESLTVESLLEVFKRYKELSERDPDAPG